MELKLVQKEVPIWVEEEPIVKKESVSAEAVIPDSREDAGCLVWTQGGILLKGKEPASQSCCFAGEVWASVLYLTESGKAETLRIRKSFEMPAELEGADPEALPQISWQLSALEGRLVNPRKLGVSFEIQAVVRHFRRGVALLDSELPENAPAQVHLLRESSEALTLRQVCEKSFSVRDRLTLQREAKAPRGIAGECIRFAELAAERLGARCIVKGELELNLWGPDETGLPVSCSFRIPFSQLVELDEESDGEILVQAEPSSLYLEWLEDLSGERSLDAEVHGVLQLRAFTGKRLGFTVDAYCNTMPSVPSKECRTFLRSLKRERRLLSGEESFSMPGDVQAVLAAQPFLGPPEWDREGTELPLSVELLVRREDGTLDNLHRSLRLKGEALPAETGAIRREITTFDYHTENGKLTLCSEAELVWDQVKTEKRETVTALELDPDSPRDPSALPAVSLVMNGGETLWELAKEYHSSVEAIEAWNPGQAEMLLIPAE